MTTGGVSSQFVAFTLKFENPTGRVGYGCGSMVVVNMICEFCGGETQTKKVKRQHWLQNQIYIVENMEAEVCKECGERYFHATTLDSIDRYLAAEYVSGPG